MVEIEMEEDRNRMLHSVPPHDDSPVEVPRAVRDTPPADYTLKIKNFSQLSDALKKTKADKYESADFEAGGYLWKLVLYPYGDEKRDGNEHISLFLALSESDKTVSHKNPRTPGWEVKVTYSFFVFNHFHNSYLVIPDGRIRRFRGLNAENGHGFSRLLPLSAFTNPSNGYLVDDCCAFGVELRVFSGKGETFSMVKQPKDGIFTWKLENFSTLNESPQVSRVFTAAGCQWKLSVYPKGDSRAKESLSCFLKLHSSHSIFSQRKVYVEFKLSIKNQFGLSHRERKDNAWMGGSVSAWGFANFIPLKDLEDMSKGFVVLDAVIFEVEISAISEIKYGV